MKRTVSIAVSLAAVTFATAASAHAAERPADAVPAARIVAAPAAVAPVKPVPIDRPAAHARPVAPVTMTSRLPPGTYLLGYSGVQRVLYRLAPGAKAWTVYTTVRVPAEFKDATLSPDGAKLVRVTGRTVTVANADGSGRRVVATSPPGTSVCVATWSADSSHVIYAVMTTKSGMALYRVGGDGRGAALMSGRTPTHDCEAGWTADGSRVTYTAAYRPDRPIAEYHTVYVSDGRTSRAVTLPVSDAVHLSSPWAMSPAGRYAIVAGMRTKPDGSCGDGDNFWYLADFSTGAAHRLAIGEFEGVTQVAVDAFGRALAGIQGAKGVDWRQFDAKGRYTGSLPAAPQGTTLLGRVA